MTPQQIQLMRNRISTAMTTGGLPIDYVKSQMNSIIIRYSTHSDFVGSPLSTSQNNVVKAVMDAYTTSLIPPAAPDAVMAGDIQATVKTTDSTQTTLYTYTIPTDTVYAIDAMVVARRTGGSSGVAGDGLRWTWSGVLSNVAGTISVMGTPDTTLQRNPTTWAVSASINGGTAVIKVTGLANNNITWQLLSSTINVN